MTLHCEQLTPDDMVHVTHRPGRPRGKSFHADYDGQPMCPSLTQRMHDSQFKRMSVRAALDEGKTPCGQCLGGVELEGIGR